MNQRKDSNLVSDLQTYVGGELELFQHAITWKKYWYQQVQPYIEGDVLEVGAGIGSNVSLIRIKAQSYTGAEPDPDLCEQLASVCEAQESATYHLGTIDTLDTDSRYDTIIYIDVLEHIQADEQELLKASRKLNPGGRILILCPAHQFLYSPFDESVGHFRRYNRKTLAALKPDTLSIDRSFYLDSIGCLASMANKYLLRSELPSQKQILFWDRVIVPISRVIDPLIQYKFGKTVIQVLSNQSD